MKFAQFILGILIFGIAGTALILGFEDGGHGIMFGAYGLGAGIIVAIDALKEDTDEISYERGGPIGRPPQ